MIDLSKLITAEQKRAAFPPAAVAQLRIERQPIIGILDGLQASALAAGDTLRASAIEQGKQGLRDITKINLSACTTPEECKAVILAAYKAIAAALPADVRLAFASAVK